jgi:hypothetical protein
VLYKVSGVCWQFITAAAVAGHGHTVAVASSRASSEEDKVRVVLLVLIRAKGYMGWVCDGLGRVLGCCWALVLGSAAGLLRPGKPLLLSFLFLFLVFNSILHPGFNSIF